MLVKLMNEGGYSREVSLNRGKNKNDKQKKQIKERYTATTSSGTSTTHSGTATTRQGTVTIYSDSYNLILTDRDESVRGGWKEMLLNTLCFFFAFPG